MKRESTENRALWVGVAWIQYFLFLRSAPPSAFPSLSFSLFLYQYFACLPRVSAFKNLATGGSRYIRTGFHIRKVLGFWPRTTSPWSPPPVTDLVWRQFHMGLALQDSVFYSTSLGAAPVNFIQYRILTAEDTSHRKISRLVSRLYAMQVFTRFIYSVFIFILYHEHILYSYFKNSTKK